MNEELERAFYPWKIGTVEIKNRIVMTSMGGTGPVRMDGKEPF